MKTILCIALLFAAIQSHALAADAPTPSRPNILFAVADDWGYGNAGAYGCRWVKTPAFDRVASQGLLFTHAYTPDGKCAPSRACILTGRNPWQNGAACNHVCYFPPDLRVFTEALADAGYFVGYTGKGWAPGVAVTADGKPRPLTGKLFDRRHATPPTRFVSNNDYAGNFDDFLDSNKGQKPWFFWYGGHEPHRPYDYGSGVRVGGKKLSDIDRVPPYWPDNDAVRNDLLDYAFKVEYFDLHLGRMLDALAKRGLLENTIVIVTSDNGMPFPRIKGQAYDGSDRLPLAISWKAGIRGAPGRRIDDYVSFIDFAPTIFQAAGLAWKDSAMAPSPGHSLFDIFASEKSGQADPIRDHVLIGKERTDVGRPHDWGYPIRGIIKNDLMYLENFEPNRWPGGNPITGYLDCDGGPTKTQVLNLHRAEPSSLFWALAFGKRPRAEFYDLAVDPDFMRNLAADAAHSAQLGQLRQQMYAELKEQQDPRMFGNGGVFEAFPYAEPGIRNFYERFMSGEKMRTGWVEPSDFEKDDD